MGDAATPVLQSGAAFLFPIPPIGVLAATAVTAAAVVISLSEGAYQAPQGYAHYQNY